MLAVLAYCFSNNIRFFLWDKNWNHGNQYGWNDYFQSLDCNSISITQADIKTQVNWYFARISAYFSPITRGKLSGSFGGVEVKTPELTDKILKFRFNRVKTVGGMMRFVDLQSAFARLVFRLSPSVLGKVQKTIRELKLNHSNYISLHIRRGDKILEAPGVETAKFIACIEELNIEFDCVFVASDDYRAVEELTAHRPDWKVKSLVDPGKTGHDQQLFNSMSKQVKFEETIVLLTEVYLHCQAKCFIGSISSNVSRFIALHRSDRKTTISMDTPQGSNIAPYFTFWEDSIKVDLAQS